MRKGISLGTAIILAGLLGITLPGCSEDKNTSGTGGDAAKSSGGATGSKSSRGVVLARAEQEPEQAEALLDREAVDQLEAAPEAAEAAPGEADHRTSSAK